MKWRQRDAGDGYSYFVVQHSGKCLHVPEARTVNGTPLTQWTCLDQPHLQWRLMRAPD
ncbi:RICIN domain-containing protein [Sorangium sp. So ce1182]|uniref:RICIN domain-containing protein n=1 Tax=Sorangium sp. So ce1182 TaxID=3133334 RepID=UPI003F617B07